MKYTFKTSLLSLSTAVLLGMTGCSDKAVEDLKKTVAEFTEIEEVTTINGKAVDGYLKFSTVCLDLDSDGFCQPTEPFTLTDADGVFTLTLTEAQKNDSGYKSAQLVVYGGQDSDRPGEDFIGKLKAPNDGSGSVNVTPVSTLVSAYIENSGGTAVSIEDIDAAKQKVADVLGLTTAQVSADPRVGNDAELMNATLQIQYAVNTMVEAADSTDSSKDVAENIFAALASGLDSVQSSGNVADGVQAIFNNADATKLNAIDTNLVQVVEVAQAAATNVNTVMSASDLDVSDTTELSDALTKVVVYKENVVAQIKITTDFSDLNTTHFDFTQHEFNFEEEAAKIYLSDLDVNITAPDFNITAYAGHVSFDMDLDELHTEFQNDTNIANAIQTEIDANQADADKITSDITDAQASADGEAKMAVLEDEVTILLAPTNTATVDDAKNLVTQIREGVTSFIDIDAEKVEDNTSTILGAQVDLITSKIQPAVEDIASDFETSASSLESSVKAFGDGLEANFGSVFGTETTTGAIETRLTAIDDAIMVAVGEGEKDTTSWTATAGSDTISHTYAKTDTTVTETFTLNGGIITLSYEDTEDGKINSVTKTGTLELVGTDYALTVSTLSFENNHATLQASGLITGTSNSSMTLTALDISFDLDEAKDRTPHFMNNIEGTFDGTIVSDGRTLTGKLVVSENDNTKNELIGTYTGTTGEPSFEGTITANFSVDDVKDLMQDSDNHGINPNALLMVTYDNGTKSFVESWNDYAGYAVLHTQNDRNLTCTMQRQEIYDQNNWYSTGYTNRVTCDSGSVQAYYGDNKVITLTVNGVEEQVQGAWSYMNWDGTQNLEIDLLDGHIYSSNGNLYINYHDGSASGQEVTITDISKRDAKSMDDIDADITITGTLTHATKIITATAGIKQSSNSSDRIMFAENIAIEDGTNFVRLASISAVTAKDSFMMGDEGNGDGYYDPMYSNPQYSIFESYSVNYNNNNGEDNGPEFSSVIVDDLNISITDVNGSVLTFDADVSYERNALNTENVVFNGTYTYEDTTFVGIADATMNDHTNTYSFSISGEVESSGFEPFSIAAAGSVVSDIVNAYGLYTRGAGVSEYKLGLSVVSSHDANSSESTMELNLADSNGVMATHSETWIEHMENSAEAMCVDGNSNPIQCDYNEPTISEETNTTSSEEETSFSLTLTDKDGNPLATFGEDTTGNGWEIIYSDNTTETLF